MWYGLMKAVALFQSLLVADVVFVISDAALLVPDSGLPTDSDVALGKTIVIVAAKQFRGSSYRLTR